MVPVHSLDSLHCISKVPVQSQDSLHCIPSGASALSGITALHPQWCQCTLWTHCTASPVVPVHSLESLHCIPVVPVPSLHSLHCIPSGASALSGLTAVHSPWCQCTLWTQCSASPVVPVHSQDSLQCKPSAASALCGLTCIASPVVPVHSLNTLQ